MKFELNLILKRNSYQEILKFFKQLINIDKRLKKLRCKFDLFLKF